MTFNAYLKALWSPKFYIKCYIPKYLSYHKAYGLTRILWSLLVRAEKSKMTSRIATRKRGGEVYDLLY